MGERSAYSLKPIIESPRHIVIGHHNGCSAGAVAMLGDAGFENAKY
jgi:hypothetical protein